MKKLSQGVQHETNRRKVAAQRGREEREREATGGPPILILTGHRKNRHILVKVQSSEVWLTVALFQTLCELVWASVHSVSGLVTAEPYAISRLRSAIDAATRHNGTGMHLIEQGSGPEYRVAIEKSQIAVDPSFRELPAGQYCSMTVQDGIIAAWLN